MVCRSEHHVNRVLGQTPGFNTCNHKNALTLLLLQRSLRSHGSLWIMTFGRQRLSVELSCCGGEPAARKGNSARTAFTKSCDFPIRASSTSASKRNPFAHATPPEALARHHSQLPVSLPISRSTIFTMHPHLHTEEVQKSEPSFLAVCSPILVANTLSQTAPMWSPCSTNATPAASCTRSSVAAQTQSTKSTCVCARSASSAHG